MKYAVTVIIVSLIGMMSYALYEKEKAQSEIFSLFNNMTVAVAISGSAAKTACAETIIDANKKNYISVNASEADLATFCHEVGLKVERKIKGMMR